MHSTVYWSMRYTLYLKLTSTFDALCRPNSGIKFSKHSCYIPADLHMRTAHCAVLLRQPVCSQVGGVTQLSWTIALSPALSVKMLLSVANRWRCSKMVWESKVPRRSPIQLLVEPNLAPLHWLYDWRFSQGDIDLGYRRPNSLCLTEYYLVSSLQMKCNWGQGYINNFARDVAMIDSAIF